jgi:uncharacterized membrane protein
MCIALGVAVIVVLASLIRTPRERLVPASLAAVYVGWFLTIAAMNPEARIARATIDGPIPTQATLDY